MDKLIEEITQWSTRYEFSFQFWGPGQNNLYITKGGVDIAIFGGNETPTEAMEKAVEWCNKQNQKGFKPPDSSVNNCQNCGARIAVGIYFCGECMREDDSDY